MRYAYYYYYYYYHHHHHHNRMQDINNYIPETNHVSRVCSCSVFTICATCNVISAVQYVLYFTLALSAECVCVCVCVCVQCQVWLSSVVP
jgi:hypothetical protein